MKSSAFVSAFKSSMFAGAFVFFVVIVSAFAFWVVGSAATSAIKLVAGECDKTYPAESWFKGDWFCDKRAP